MKMVSYAQNGEDVMLSRALRGVAHGFYVDAGAAGPTEHSVTRAFYDRGWTGINVEPTPRYFDQLVAARPHDVNVRAALDEADGERTLFMFEGTGLSTLDPGVAEGHQPGGWPMTRIVTPTRTLAGLCAEHAPPTIHFLKVDVEGAEARVLRGADFRRFRPWIVVVEATRPLSAESDHAGWEPILTGANYEFVWFDGLNRFYLAAEQVGALRRHFTVPVNVFDDFDLHNPLAERLAGEAATLRDRLSIAEDSTRSLRRRADGADTEVAAARAAARSAEMLATAADAASAEARRRLDRLQQALDEARHEAWQQGEAARTAHAAELAERLDALHASLRASHETELAAERTAHALLLEAARTPPAAPPQPAPAPDVPAGRGLATVVYRALFRPFVRPAMWRLRTFLFADARREQLRLHEEHGQAFRDLLARVDWLTARSIHSAERVEDGVRLIDAAVAPLRALAARPVESPPGPAPEPAADLSRLVASLETALLAFAVTVDARRVTAG